MWKIEELGLKSSFLPSWNSAFPGHVPREKCAGWFKKWAQNEKNALQRCQKDL